MNKIREFMIATLVGAMMIICGLPTFALAAPAQYPLFLGGSAVDPNVMFLLDDSGSMQWEVLPDGEISQEIRYMFPANRSYYGGDWYDDGGTSRQGGFEDNNLHNFRRRSSHENKMYYNPTRTYRPWVDADNNPWPVANPACAYHNPADISVGCRNLKVVNDGDANSNTDSYAKWRVRYSNGNYDWQTRRYYNYQTGKSGFWPAVYFVWKPNNSGCNGSSDTRACYDKVEIAPLTPTYEGSVARSDCANAPTCTYAEEILNFANWYSYHRSRILTSRAAIGRAFAQQGEQMRVGFGAINKGTSIVDGLSTSSIISGVRTFSGNNRKTFFEQLYEHVIPASSTPLRWALDRAGRYYSYNDNRGPWGAEPGTNNSSAHLTCRQSYAILMTDGYWNSSEAGVLDARQNNDGTGGPTYTDSSGTTTFTYDAVSPFADTYSNTLADVAMYYWKNDLRTNLDNRVPNSALNPAFWQHMVTFGVSLGLTGSIDPDEAFEAINTGDTITWNNPVGASDADPSKLDDLLHAAVNSRGGFFSAGNADEFAEQLSNILQDIVDRASATASAIATNSTRLDTGTRAYQAGFDSTDWSGHVTAYEIADNGTLIEPAIWDSAADGKIPEPAERNVFATVNGTAVNFVWGDMSSSQTFLTDLGITKDVVNWLRGDDANEQPSGTLRKRNKMFGDVVNSNPIVDTGTTTLYVGANDGMLHAIDAATGSYGGTEKFTYIPSGAVAHLADLASTSYEHRYYVDGSPNLATIGDATILIGTLGAGGRGVFALDVSDPDDFGVSDIKWDINHESTGFAELGYMVGQMTLKPVVGTWNGTDVLVFGNGIDSGSGAVLFVVNALSGALVTKLQVDSSAGNGLNGVALIFGSAGDIAAAYAGDMEGSLWKIDFTGSSLSGAKLFSATDSSGLAQPITAPVSVSKHPDGGNIVTFGTGRYAYGDDAGNLAVQSAYGIWDKATLTNGAWQGGWSNTTARSHLLAQQLRFQDTITTASDGSGEWRTVTDNNMDWETYRGWYFDLLSPDDGAQGERINYQASVNSATKTVRFTSIVPVESGDPCTPGSAHRWITEVDIMSGGISQWTRFDTNRDGKFNSDDTKVHGLIYVPYTSMKIGMGGVATSIEAGGNDEAILGELGEGLRIPGGPPRQSWRQLR